MNKKAIQKLASMATCAIIFISLGNTSYAWDGKADGTGTHALIAEQALKMINNDLNKSEQDKIGTNLNIMNNLVKDLKLGSTYPDYNPNAYDLYQDHFWDSDTNNNFTIDNSWYASYAIYDTAETQVRKFVALAKHQWEKGNHQQAIFLLGQGLHYLGDLNNPYHASNQTAVDTPGHVKYETYVEQRKENYAINSMNYTTDKGIYEDALKNTDINDWMTKNSTEYAKVAKDLYYSHSTMKHSYDDWEYSAIEAMKNSQECTAKLLYRFLNEVSGTVQNTSDMNNLDEFNVVIKTANEKYAGTDDYIYFGIETKDGKTYEWVLDNPGNDFEQGQEDNYIIKVKDGSKISADSINKCWIRKAKLEVGDDFKPENINVIAKSSVILEKEINKNLVGNETYYLNK
ncbi:zinc dependent phospholipase C family protein [Romboutsia lituseburensis]|uniref:zinc dependent phospholipase C family protein n=1 Tax=Romboutsia lituseburensis TaxID=1537 RepID=UPI00215A64BA|nr:zinc dependent phospholipase C family protein [Romboutsia lituseburensis]MCR8745467.1 zinc dependent phospholipase C family protein [Romboutsia lituseburensis]